jgi:hypothetical protein
MLDLVDLYASYNVTGRDLADPFSVFGRTIFRLNLESNLRFILSILLRCSVNRIPTCSMRQSKPLFACAAYSMHSNGRNPRLTSPILDLGWGKQK